MLGNFRRHPVLLTLGIAALAIISNWLLTTDNQLFVTSDFTSQPMTKVGSKSIKTVEIDITDGIVMLNISLTTPMDCNEIYRHLGLEPMKIKDKVYTPVCEVVNPLFIQVQYKEFIST